MMYEICGGMNWDLKAESFSGSGFGEFGSVIFRDLASL